MSRAEQQPSVESPHSDALAADSRERALRALLRCPTLRRLWSAQVVGGIGDALGLLVLVLLTLQASVVVPPGADAPALGGGYRGAALAVAAVFAVRVLSTLVFGALLLGPLASLTAPSGPLDRRWTMVAADGIRIGLLFVAPLWISWVPGSALWYLLGTVFLAGAAERCWTVARDRAAPALLPVPSAEDAAVRPLPDHQQTLRRLWLRTGFAALPLAAAALVTVTLVSNVLASWVEWFGQHQAALASYVAAGLFASSISVLYFLEFPGTATPRPRSPLEGLRRPRTDGGADKGRTGAIGLLVLSGAAVAAAVAAAVSLAALHAADLGGGPVAFGLLVLALTGGTAVGIGWAPRVLPGLSRRRLLVLAVTATGAALLAAGLTGDPTSVLLILLLAGVGAGVAARTGHTLLDLETEEHRRARLTDHLHAVVRLSIALVAVGAPVLAAFIGPHRVQRGDFVFDHGGAAFALILVGALLLPVAALVLGRTDDRQGVPFHRDLRQALRGETGGEPRQAPAATGFFIAVEGGDGAGKSTQVEVLAEWIRSKGHEVVVTREPGATPIGKRLRSILLDVSSAGLSHRAEALLYAADRAEHVDSVIRPALERGAVVISDRYTDSSVAYQGAGRDLSPVEVARISRWATDGLVPHLTVLLDISPQTARERFTEAPDRLESESSDFHQRVRSGFLTLAAADPARYLVVDAGEEQETVTTVVRHRLDEMLPLSEAEIAAREEARKAAEEERRRRAEEEAARKAEEERQERERQEQLARLRAEEEERRRREKEREEEEARERAAAREAEEARKRAEEAERRAEQERQRREDEERQRQQEEERRRRQAEEEERLRAQAEERRKERQRRAEEALLRAERARQEQEQQTSSGSPGAGPGDAAGTAGEVGEGGETGEAATVPNPVVEPEASEGRTPERGRDRQQERGDAPRRDTGGTAGAATGTPTGTPGGTSAGASAEESAETRTVEIPQHPAAGPVDTGGTAGTPGRTKDTGGTGGNPDEEETSVLPSVQQRRGRPGTGSGPDARKRPDAEETARLPQQPADPAGRVPPWLFRPQQGAPDERTARVEQERPVERTRKLPQIDPAEQPKRGRRSRRRAWAEETPLDDLPTLADELLGPQGDGSVADGGSADDGSDGSDGGADAEKGRRKGRG